MKNIYIPVFGFGKTGGFRVLSYLATVLSEQGRNVYFITTSSDLPYYPTSAKVIYTKGSSLKNSTLRFIIDSFIIRKKIKTFESGTVIPNQYLTMYATLFLGSKFKRFYFIQAFETRFVTGIFKKGISFATYFMSSYPIYNNKNILPSFFYKKKHAIIPPGYDQKLFFKKDKVRGNVINIGFIGRLERYKGSNEIISALEKLKEETDCGFRINIAVYDVEIPEKLRPYTTFYPINSDQELAEFYRGNDLFIATGLIEDGSFHYPCLEAMASGCLVISNYEPLSNLESKFRVEKVTKEKIFELVKLYFTTPEVEIENEIMQYDSTVRRYDWNNVGQKVNKFLVDNGG